MKRFKFYLQLAGQRRRWQILRSRKQWSSQSMSGELCLHSQLLWLLPTPGTNTCFTAFFFSKKHEKNEWKGKAISEVSGDRCELTVCRLRNKETQSDRSEKGQNWPIPAESSWQEEEHTTIPGCVISQSQPASRARPGHCWVLCLAFFPHKYRTWPLRIVFKPQGA